MSVKKFKKDHYRDARGKKASTYQEEIVSITCRECQRVVAVAPWIAEERQGLCAVCYIRIHNS